MHVYWQTEQICRLKCFGNNWFLAAFLEVDTGARKETRYIMYYLFIDIIYIYILALCRACLFLAHDFPRFGLWFASHFPCDTSNQHWACSKLSRMLRLPQHLLKRLTWCDFVWPGWTLGLVAVHLLLWEAPAAGQSLKLRSTLSSVRTSGTWALAVSYHASKQRSHIKPGMTSQIMTGNR